MASGKIPRFAKFEDPLMLPDGSTWLERVHALATQHKGVWAKYGPIGTTDSAERSARNLKSWFRNESTHRWESDLDVFVDESGPGALTYLFVRVVDKEIHDDKV